MDVIEMKSEKKPAMVYPKDAAHLLLRVDINILMHTGKKDEDFECMRTMLLGIEECVSDMEIKDLKPEFRKELPNLILQGRITELMLAAKSANEKRVLYETLGRMENDYLDPKANAKNIKYIEDFIAENPADMRQIKASFVRLA